MADNTTLNTGTGGDVIATDDLTTLNGGAVSGVKVQRVKAGYGVDGTLVDVSAAFPLPGNVTDGTNIGKVSANGEQIVSFIDLLPAAQSITAQDIVSTSVSGANNQSIVTGTPTAGSVASVAVSGDSSFSIQISGTWTGTLAFERSLDAGTTYTPIGAFSAGTSFITATVTQNGAFHGNAASATNIRVRSTATWTGTASVKLLAGAGGSTITVGNPLRLFDKSSGVEHSIKAASAAAVATDTALVVGLHPSSALPSGANIIGGVTLNNVAASGNITTQNLNPATTATAGSAVGLSVNGAATATIQITGTYTGALTLQFTVDGTNWITCNDASLYNANSGLYNFSIPSGSVGIYKASIAGFTQFRITALAAVTGTSTVSIIGSVGTLSAIANPTINQNLVGGATITVGNGVTGGGSQRVTIASDNTPYGVKITDGTTPAVVKAASTASVATDASLVVALSPNSPLTLGTPTAFSLSSAATTNATSVKASAGTVFQITASNVGAAAAFLKVFNLAVAPTVGTSVPLLTIPIAASGVVNIPFGTLGMRLGTGISISITNLVADADATAVAAAQVKVMVSYL